MTRESAGMLKKRLRALGLSERVIAAAWPAWWSELAEESQSARAELRFGIARRLGLDPSSLLETTDEPRFLWRDEARFKHLSGENDQELAGITSFGRAVASVLINGLPLSESTLVGRTASELRSAVLESGAPFVALEHLLLLSWGLGIPVAHLRVFPWPQKRMAAMVVMVRDRAAVLLGKDSDYPARIAFYLAHELGHIALGHVSPDRQIVDLDTDDQTAAGDDQEEQAADAYALELLTGESEPSVFATGPGRLHSRALADASQRAATELRIEPGTLVLSFGHSTGDWRTTTAALGLIYPEAAPVWMYVNAIARRELSSADLATDSRAFLDAVLGTSDYDAS